MKVEVSVGEVIDKLSILDIKFTKLEDPEKRANVEKERDALAEIRKKLQEFPYSFWYDLLVYVNTQIWELTDKVKALSYITNPAEFSKLSHTIFELNQQRFRLKDRFNRTLHSELKEEKSYGKTVIRIRIDSLDSFYKNLAKINKAGIEYDSIELVTPYQKEVNSIYNSYPYVVL
jgi:hypothetical protein